MPVIYYNAEEEIYYLKINLTVRGISSALPGRIGDFQEEV